MATQREAPGLWLSILLREIQRGSELTGGERPSWGEAKPESTSPSEFSTNVRTQREDTRAPIPSQVSTERAWRALRPLSPSGKRPSPEVSSIWVGKGSWGLGHLLAATPEGSPVLLPRKRPQTVPGFQVKRPRQENIYVPRAPSQTSQALLLK